MINYIYFSYSPTLQQADLFHQPKMAGRHKKNANKHYKGKKPGKFTPFSESDESIQAYVIRSMDKYFNMSSESFSADMRMLRIWEDFKFLSEKQDLKYFESRSAASTWRSFQKYFADCSRETDPSSESKPKTSSSIKPSEGSDPSESDEEFSEFYLDSMKVDISSSKQNSNKNDFIQSGWKLINLMSPSEGPEDFATTGLENMSPDEVSLRKNWKHNLETNFSAQTELVEISPTELRAGINKLLIKSAIGNSLKDRAHTIAQSLISKCYLDIQSCNKYDEIVYMDVTWGLRFEGAKLQSEADTQRSVITFVDDMKSLLRIYTQTLVEAQQSSITLISSVAALQTSVNQSVKDLQNVTEGLKRLKKGNKQLDSQNLPVTYGTSTSKGVRKSESKKECHP